MTTDRQNKVPEEISPEAQQAAPFTGLRWAFVTDSLISGGLGLVANICSYLFIMWAGRSLPPNHFGLFATFVSVFTLTAVFANAIQMRVNQILTGQSIQTAWVFLRKLWWQQGIAILLAALAILPFVSWISDTIESSIIDLAACFLCVITIFGYSSLMGLLGSLHRIRLQAGSSTLGAMLKFGLAVGLGFWSDAVALWLLAYLLHYGAVILVGGWILKSELARSKHSHDVQDISVTEPVLKNVLPYLLGVVPLVADQIYVRMWATDLSGAYGGLTTLARISFYACGSVFAVMLPYLLRETHHGRSTKSLLQASVALVALIAGSAAAVLTLFPHEIRAACFGPRYVEVGALLPLLGWAAALYSCNYATLLFLFVRRKAGLLLALLLIPIVLQALLFCDFGGANPPSLGDFALAQFAVVLSQSAVIVAYLLTGYVRVRLAKL